MTHQQTFKDLLDFIINQLQAYLDVNGHDQTTYNHFESLRKEILTHHRMGNVAQLLTTLHGLKQLGRRNMTLFELSGYITDIHTALSNHAKINENISIYYDKQHCSVRQATLNAKTPIDKLASLRHVTLFQSRATKAFERSIAAVEQWRAASVFRLGSTSR